MATEQENPVSTTTTRQVTPGDTPLADIAEGVREAREAILATFSADPTHAWRPRELIDAAKGALPTSVASIAFWNLVESGELEVDERLVVRTVHLV
jgi:hypothetical protein